MRRVSGSSAPTVSRPWPVTYCELYWCRTSWPREARFARQLGLERVAAEIVDLHPHDETNDLAADELRGYTDSVCHCGRVVAPA